MQKKDGKMQHVRLEAIASRLEARGHRYYKKLLDMMLPVCTVHVVS